MALWPNGNVSTLTRTRFMAGAGPLRNSIHGNNGGERFNRFASAYWSKIFGAAPGSGHYAGSAWVLPMTAGAISSSTGNILAATVSTLNVVAGRNIDGSISCTLTVPSVNLSLIVNLEGAATLTLTVTDATLAAGIFASGSAAASVTVDPATIGALAGIFGSVSCTADASTSTLTAVGHLSGDILPYTELSPENLAATVWNSLASDYNTAGTMGLILGSTLATKVDEVHQIHGLKSGSPMTVTPTARTVGTIAQAISGDGSTSTTVTRS